MSAVWQRSDDDDLSTAELFPLPIVRVTHAFDSGLITIDCLNLGLEGLDTLAESELNGYCIEEPDDLVTVSLIYTNPTDQKVSQEAFVFLASKLREAIDEAGVIYERGSQPIIRLNIQN